MKKIIIILLALLLAFLLGLLSSFYFQVQHTYLATVVSRLLLEHSMPLKVTKKFDETIYFATDRKELPNKKSNTLKTSPDLSEYSNQYAGNISYGTINILIPHNFHTGDSLASTAIKKITPLSSVEFLNLLKTKNDKPFIIWIHGYKTSFKTNATYFGQLANDLNIDAVFLTYDWTSSESPLGYKNDLQQLNTSATLFTQFIEKIVQDVKPKKIIIIAHSLGSRLIALSFDQLYKNPNFSDIDTEFSHVVFLAPNVDRNDFDQNFKNQLTSMVKKLTVYVASNDNALLLSKYLYQIDSLGLPTDFSAETNLDEIQALLYYQKSLPHTIDIVDVSYFPKRDLSQHLYFKERPIIEDMHWLINSDYVPQDRYLLKQNENPKNANSYWFIPP